MALHELAGDPIDHIKHSAAVRPQHDLAGAALPIDVGEDWNLGRIPIELVMRRELVIPLELARIRVESDHRAAIEIVTEPGIAIPVGTGVAGSPVRQVQIGVIGTGHPNGGAAVHPGITAPGFMTGLARAGNRVESSNFFSGIHIEGSDESAQLGNG